MYSMSMDEIKRLKAVMENAYTELTVCLGLGNMEGARSAINCIRSCEKQLVNIRNAATELVQSANGVLEMSSGIAADVLDSAMLRYKINKELGNASDAKICGYPRGFDNNPSNGIITEYSGQENIAHKMMLGNPVD